MSLNLGSNNISPVLVNNIINNQSNKTITPSTSQQTVSYDSGYAGLNQVTVNAIPSDYIIPSGTLTITNSGTVNAKSYASVSIPGMANPTWTTPTITSNTGKINYSITLSSGFKSVSQSFSNSITLPSVAGASITPSTTAQTAVASYQWTKGSIIVNAIPSTVGVYKKIIEKTITCSELNAFLSSQTTIPSFAFLSTSTLNGTIEASTITGIGDSAFQSCYNISSINFANVTSIGGYGFAYCSKLVSISIPNVISLYSTFTYCYSLTNVSLPKVEYAASAFSYCSSLSTITLPQLKNLAGYNFYQCSRLISAYFPEVTSINGYANFQACYQLTTISLPKVTYIYAYQFRNCSALSTISFPLLETFSYAAGMFSNCKNLRSIYLMSTSVVFLSQSTIFNSSPVVASSYLSGVYASIYVPTSLLASYKTHSMWSWFSDRFVGV